MTIFHDDKCFLVEGKIVFNVPPNCSVVLGLGVA